MWFEMKRYLAAIAWLLLMVNAPGELMAQISRAGTPPGFDLITTRSTIPMEVMRPVAVQELLEEDLIIDKIKDIPWRFGENIEVEINPDNSGIWYPLEGRGRLWQTTISSPGALSLNLTFNRYRLPPGAELYVYTLDRKVVLGAFTDFNNQPDGFFATALLMSDKVVVEYYEPSGVDFPGELNIQTVTHGYRDVQDYVKSFGQSGGCNLNVVCDEIAGFENQVRSVALMLAGGNGFCTGALINSTGKPGRPLFLSASHCAFNPGSLVLWFNWQSPTCTNPTTSPPFQSMSGAVELARYEESDFYLLELLQEVPLDYNPYFSGWNRTMESTLPGKIVGLHHPRADIKKMAYSTSGANVAAYGGITGSGNTHWRIIWSGGTTTEPASSGSPLFDSQGRIIGQLHGGIAACGNAEPDWYGRVGISWDGGGTPQSSLKGWLDPAHTGMMAINGYDPLVDHVEDPDEFHASVVNDTSVLLQWKPDSLVDYVMIAVNTVDKFGLPMGNYTLDNELAGGGKIIYFGNGERFIHSNRAVGEHYYYKVWSFNPSYNYSTGVKADVRINCPDITILPWQEGFNAPGMLPCWSQEQEQGFESWMFDRQSLMGQYLSYEGNSFTAFITDSLSQVRSITRLISPVMNLGNQQHVRLAFYYFNAPSSTSADSLYIFSRTHAEEPWQLEHVIHHEQHQWELINIPLTLTGDKFQLSFQASAGPKGAIALDGVMVYSDTTDLIPHPENLKIKSINENSVALEWTLKKLLPESAMVPEGYIVFKDGKKVFTTKDLTETRFLDPYLPVGQYEYYVKAYYPNGFESEASNKARYEVMAKGNDATLSVNISGFGKISLPPGIYHYPRESPLDILAVPSPGWVFSHWIVNEGVVDSIPVLELNIEDDLNVIAIFRLKVFSVEINVNPPGAALSTKGQGNYGNQSQVMAAVSPSTGYVFSHWEASGTIISTEENLPLRILSDTVVTAHFNALDYRLRLSAEPSEAGRVYGEGFFQAFSPVRIEAVAEAGWRFMHWQYVVNNETIIASELPESLFTLSDNIFLTAVFTRAEFIVNIQTRGEGTTFPPPGEYTYSFGKVIELTVAAQTNWEFEKWMINNEVVEEAGTEIIVERNTVITAVFQPLVTLSNSMVNRKLRLYPVPVSGNLWVEFPEAGDWHLYIYNLSGQVLLHQQTSHDIHLDVSILEAGVYLLRAENSTLQEYMKFIKE